MPLVAGLLVVIQFCFAFHALRTARPCWWVFVIMGFPVMGCLIYYLVEVYPGSREQRSAQKAARKLARALQPDADLRLRAEQLEICGSVENRMALAEECMSREMYGEAVKLFESCLSGAFHNDGALLLGMARAAVEHGDWDKAEDALSRLGSAAPKVQPQAARLLKARALEGRGRTDEALAAYKELVPVFVGLEARYRYAACLSRLGQHAAASHMLDEVIQHSTRFTSSMEDEQHWVDAAHAALVDNTQHA